MVDKKVIRFFGSDLSKLRDALNDKSTDFTERFERLESLRTFRRLKLQQADKLIDEMSKSKNKLEQTTELTDKRWRQINSDKFVLDDPKALRKGSRRIAMAFNKILAGYDQLLEEMDTLLKPSK